ncbi:PREDICTED: beta-1,3-galactosyltransferase 5-like [Drosophila arizonae]|uniref:Hexosyltransferase n=1 Tax=Drosophila arizonae TaxID=7263 RepID=A0ABM1NPD5_DROAR|nr:PREDICTED: beta-1,3-galactosyltransferase 5-like [Drosophila arizonae]
MKQIKCLISFLESSSNVCLLLWMTLCVVIYAYLPNMPQIVPQPEIAVDPNMPYTLVCAPYPGAYHDRRSAIRQTWGHVATNSNSQSSLRLLFLFGTVADDELQSSLLAEHEQHNDLLQGNFLDGYYNLTYKHVMALKWFHTRCDQAPLLVKVDDDIFLNTLQLQHHLSHPSSTWNPLSALHSQRQLLLCAINKKDRVARSYSSKWRVGFREYPHRYYPPFCPGFAVFYSSQVAKRLYFAAQRSNFFRLDDVLITGILSKRCNITLTDLTSYVLYPNKLKLLLKGRLEPEEYLVSWHKMSPQQIFRLWQLHGMVNTTNTVK